jgi:hypothetical protein
MLKVSKWIVSEAGTTHRSLLLSVTLWAKLGSVTTKLKRRERKGMGALFERRTDKKDVSEDGTWDGARSKNSSTH